MRARLKIYAETEIVELKDNPDLFNLLKPEDYRFTPERLMLFHIEAYDWNCPQHITPRYTVDEIKTMMEPQMKYISELEAEIKALQQQLANKQLTKTMSRRAFLFFY